MVSCSSSLSTLSAALPSADKDRRSHGGEGGCDAAGENTSTPESRGTISSEVKYCVADGDSGPSIVIEGADATEREESAAATEERVVAPRAPTRPFSARGPPSTMPSVRTTTYDAMSYRKKEKKRTVSPERCKRKGKPPPRLRAA
jgi:hypothetical protein